MDERQFVGAKVGEVWYCCSCFDLLFTVAVADTLMKHGVVGDLHAVYTTDEWVQEKTCAGCHERFDTEP